MDVRENVTFKNGKLLIRVYSMEGSWLLGEQNASISREQAKELALKLNEYANEVFKEGN